MAYIGCDGVVFKEGRILLQQREDFRTWGQPGGGLELGEYLLDAARREVREETGIEVDLERLAAVHYRRFLGKDILVFTFAGRPVGGALRPSNETVDVGYFGPDALPQPMHPLSQARLRQVLEGNGRFVYGVQSSSRRSQAIHAVRLIGRTVRNKIQRRLPWHPRDFSIGAFATIWDQEGRVLLLHRRDMDAWNLPGGQVEAGESPWEACVREVREETGLETSIERLSGVYAKPHKDTVVFNFDCVIIGGRLQATDEADQAAYFRLDELPETLLARQQERILDAAGANRVWPLVKNQGADWGLR